MQSIRCRLGAVRTANAWKASKGVLTQRLSSQRRDIAGTFNVPLGSFKSTEERRFSQGSGPERLPYKAFLLDMDGVLHRFGTPVKGAKEFVDHLQTQQIPYILLTNECRYTNHQLHQKLTDVGIEIPVERMYTSSNSTRDFFRTIIGQGWSGNIFYIGEEGVGENLEQAVRGTTCRVYGDLDCAPQDISYVVVGTVHTGSDRDDSRFHERACEFVAQGARLVYTCPDYFEVTADGRYKFGCPMPVVGLIEHVTGSGSYNLGKPNPHMLRMAHQQLVQGLFSKLSSYEQAFVHPASTMALQEVLFVGDSLGTDIRTAIENGIDAALVLSGTTSKEALQASALRPNYVFDDIGALHEALEAGYLYKDLRRFQ